MRNPESSDSTTSPLDKLRRTVLVAALTVLAACQPNRTGPHIEIADPAANIELEALRRAFVKATQQAQYDELVVSGLLGGREMLLEKNKIPPNTEKWYASGTPDGPVMIINVDNAKCESTPNCTVKPADSDFPDID